MFGIGDDFAPDFPPDDGKWGWYLWRMSGKQRIYTREEVAGLDKNWLSEIFFNETIAEWVSNDSPLMGMLNAQRPGGQGEIQAPILGAADNAPKPPPE